MGSRFPVHSSRRKAAALDGSRDEKSGEALGSVFAAGNRVCLKV
jgi:hypothetical protein